MKKWMEVIIKNMMRACVVDKDKIKIGKVGRETHKKPISPV